MTPPIIVWFRRDLRLADNPALHAAVETGRPVVPVFIESGSEEAPWQPGGAARWWLHQSLAALGKSLAQAGAPLVLRQGAALAQLERLLGETGATAVYWNRLYEPALIERETRIKAALKARGVEARSFKSAVLLEGHEIATKQGKPYTVFSPFWRAVVAMEEPAPALPAPERLHAPGAAPESLPLEALGLLPRIDWAAGMREEWSPGEAGALRRLARFTDRAMPDYDEERNRPDHYGTSRLSPHLHWGEVSPRQVWHAARRASRGADAAARGAADHFLREVGWREFAHHLLTHFPRTDREPLRADFAAFPWREDAALLRAWRRGRTGYPIVDAGMRELWATGWMHNRVRMIVASFLVKHLLQPWQRGAEWFWDTLVDANLANNTLGWQWSAGCGADAAPYFRIFNPVLQAEKFDPDGAYTRRWVPELAKLAAPHIHKPWMLSPAVLRAAGVSLGADYPRPVVDHAQARERALAAFAAIRKGGAG
ncbi:MAG: deoxyribodipyrimidine photo-lyase [Candidatus Sumerlaeia bacterium]|nr:deoxyribodipyrimidine photo-lyase [Candidatus Sumerlaeia bacterium]